MAIWAELHSGGGSLEEYATRQGDIYGAIQTTGRGGLVWFFNTVPGMPRHETWIRGNQTAIAAGVLSAGAVDALGHKVTDSDAVWEPDALTEFEMLLWRARLERSQAAAILSNTATEAVVEGLTDVPEAEDGYAIEMPNRQGTITDVGDDWFEDSDADWPVGYTGDDLVGVPVIVVRASTGAIQRKHSYYDSTPTRMQIFGSLWTDYGGWMPAVGDLYIIGGWPFQWRSPALTGKGMARTVRAARIRVDVTAEGPDGAGVYLWARVRYSGRGMDQADLREWVIPINASGDASQGSAQNDWVSLPNVWGLFVQVDVYGVARNQRVRIRSIEIDMEGV